MITNLLATLTTVLVTNTTERFPMLSPGVYALSNPPQFISQQEPTQKWIKTEVIRQEWVEFTVGTNGFKGIISQEVVESKEVEYTLKRDEQWIRKEP